MAVHSGRHTAHGPMGLKEQPGNAYRYARPG